MRGGRMFFLASEHRFCYISSKLWSVDCLGLSGGVVSLLWEPPALRASPPFRVESFAWSTFPCAPSASAFPDYTYVDQEVPAVEDKDEAPVGLAMMFQFLSMPLRRRSMAVTTYAEQKECSRIL